MLPIARGIYKGLSQMTRVSRTQSLHSASALRCKAETSAENEPVAEENEEVPSANSAVDPKDRTKVIPVETSIRYLNSEAYKTTYGEEPVWTQYR